MGPKKKAAEDADDVSVEQFMKLYKKNCTNLGITQSKQVKEKYEEYVEDQDKPIQKVSAPPVTFAVPHLGAVGLAGRQDPHGLAPRRQVPAYQKRPHVEDRLRGRGRQEHLRLRQGRPQPSSPRAARQRYYPARLRIPASNSEPDGENAKPRDAET